MIAHQIRRGDVIVGKTVSLVEFYEVAIVVYFEDSSWTTYLKDEEIKIDNGRKPTDGTFHS